MGSCIPFIDEQPFAERVKTLADDELLEIWKKPSSSKACFAALCIPIWPLRPITKRSLWKSCFCDQAAA